MALKPVSVTQLNEYISRVLTTDPLLGNLQVIGEITNLKYHSSGHIYFSIKDENSKINCFIPSSYISKIKYELGDGLEVIISGYINVYKKGGMYTLFVRNIEISGDGNLSTAFNLLKDKLEKEGLFLDKYKKPIPCFPRKIGVITSETGAAVHDIIKIIKNRTSLTDIIIFPVLVQGPNASQDIAATIDFINQEFDDIDTLIVGRGGGSMEDLWPFNEEILARAIFNSKIPIISAVGHETDFTISDFVADMRAPTPTAAAEMAVPDMDKIILGAENLKNSISTQLSNKIKYNELLVENLLLSAKSVLEKKVYHYEHYISLYKLVLDENNPAAILSKGYSVVENKNGKIVSSVNDFKLGKEYSITFKDGIQYFKAVTTEGEA